MKKDRAQKKAALELKLARIRQLSAGELGVAEGGRCDETGHCGPNCSISACDNGSCDNSR
jgi:hypothetical protein